MLRDSCAVLQDLLSRHRCPEISVQYTCGHCQEATVVLPPVLQKKEGRLSGRAASQVLKAQCKRCERGRGAGPVALGGGAEDDTSPQFRVEIPLGRCSECQHLGQPEEQRGERDALRCGGVLIDLSSAREKLEDAVPIAVGARQLLQWVQLPPQAKPQRILLMSARPDPPGGDLACSVVERVRKATGWSPFLLAVIAWTLGCVVYAIRQKPENPAVNPDLLYEQFQRRIEDIPVPESSPQYQQYRQYYLRQYEQHLQEYSAMNAQWQQNRPLFSWQAFLHGMGVGLLVFSAALAFCEYNYGTISCWMELAEDLWYVWRERWSKTWDPLGDSQKMERFLKEMGEEPKKIEAPQPEVAAPSARQPPAAPRTAPAPLPPPMPQARSEAPGRETAPANEQRAPASAPMGASFPAATPRAGAAPAGSPAGAAAAAAAAACPAAPAAPAAAAACPTAPVARTAPAPVARTVPAAATAAAAGAAADRGAGPRTEPTRAAASPWALAEGQGREAPEPPGAPAVPQSRMSGRSGEGAGSNVRERLRRKVIERHREQIRHVVTSDPPMAHKAPPAAVAAPCKQEKVSSRTELLREAEELLCQLEAESLLKQLAEEEERKRSLAEKKRAKQKAADRKSKGSEPVLESDISIKQHKNREAGRTQVEAMKADEEANKDAEVMGSAGSEDSGGDDSIEAEETPVPEPNESLTTDEPEESLPSARTEESLPSAEPEESLPSAEPEESSPSAEPDEPPALGEVEEPLAVDPELPGFVADEALEVVVGKGRRRQRRRASQQARLKGAMASGGRVGACEGDGSRAVCGTLTEKTPVEAPAVDRAGRLEAAPPEAPQNSTELRIRNTFFELPDELARLDARPRARSAPCRVGAERAREDAVVPGAGGAGPAPSPQAPRAPAAAPGRGRNARPAEEAARAAQKQRAVEERAQRQRKEAERRERRDPNRPGVWDVLPRAARPSQPSVPIACRRDAAAKVKEEPQPRPAERRDKDRPGVWDDLPPRTQSGPVPHVPLGPPLSREAGAKAGASILKALRGSSGPDAKACTLSATKPPVEPVETTPTGGGEQEERRPESSSLAEAGAQGEEASPAAKPCTLRADAPEFVPAPPVALVEPTPEQAMVPAMFVIGPNQQMMPVQVLPMPLPEGGQLMGPIGPMPLPDGMQGQAIPLLPMPVPGQVPEDGMIATPCSGEATPMLQYASDDLLAQHMEILRAKLEEEQQHQQQWHYEELHHTGAVESCA